MSSRFVRARVLRQAMTAAAAAGALLVLAGCSAPNSVPAAALSPSTTATAPAATAAPTTSSTPTPALTDVDPADYPLDNVRSGNKTLVGVAFDAPNRDMHCGIYSNWWVDPTNHDKKGLMFGCRMEQGHTFTYPATPNPGGVGGCPSGFTVSLNEATAVLCNSGLVFTSELQTAKQLQTGQRITYDGAECIGLRDGIRCENLTSRHGFTLTPSDYTLF